MSAVLILVLALFLPRAGAQAPTADTSAAESKGGAETYQTLYLTSLTQVAGANDIQTDLRNMLPNARLYVPSQNAISIRELQTRSGSRRRSSQILIEPEVSAASPTRSPTSITARSLARNISLSWWLQAGRRSSNGESKCRLYRFFRRRNLKIEYPGAISRCRPEHQGVPPGWILRWVKVAHKDRAVGCCR